MSTTRRIRIPSRLLIPLFLVVIVTTGCQTTVGNYFTNRGRDLGECFRLQVGGGPGLGVGARVGGLLDVGLGVATYYREHGVGWHYGDGYAFGIGTTGELEEWDVNFTILQPLAVIASPFLLLGPPEIHGGNLAWLFLAPPHWETMKSHKDGWKREHSSWAVIPAYLSLMNDETPEVSRGSDLLWSRQVTDVTRKARVHAFDVEASVYAGIVYARAGFSPGELLDFLLGWFGVDIAGDDRGLGPEEKTGEGVGEE